MVWSMDGRILEAFLLIPLQLVAYEVYASNPTLDWLIERERMNKGIR